MSIKNRAEFKIGLGLLLGGILLLGIWLASVTSTAISLAHQARQAQSLATQNPLDVDPETVETLLRGTRRDIVKLKRQVGWLAHFGPHLEGVPRVGPLLADAPAWLTLADTLSESGLILWEDAAPAWQLLQSGTPATEALSVALPLLQEDAPQVRPLLDRAQAAYETLHLAAYPGEVQDLVLKLGRGLPLLRDGVAWSAVAPALLGDESSPRTYLVLALNEDELRPGGGFITGVGEVQIAGGKVLSMTFRDSYAVDDFKQPYPLAPEPFKRFMGLDLWVFRDSNWSPDFPTSARQAIDLYRPGHPVTITGVIAADQAAAKALVDALGPLHVPGEAQPVTGDSLLTYIYHAWKPEDGQMGGDWWSKRKAFMGSLADAALQQVQSGAVDPLRLAETALQLLEEKHLQLYFSDPAAESLLAERGWDSRVRPPQADMFMLAEANLGYNKASARIERRAQYTVDLRQTPRASVVLTYTHTGRATHPCEMRPRYDPEYTQMMNRCYWAYVRLFVPPSATDLRSDLHPISGTMLADPQGWPGSAIVAPPENGCTVFAQALFLPLGERTALHFDYTLPPRVVTRQADGSWLYRLDLRKQAGLKSLPLRVIVLLPPDATVLDTSLPPLTSSGGRLTFQVSLRRDLTLWVRYR